MGEMRPPTRPGGSTLQDTLRVLQKENARLVEENKSLREQLAGLRTTIQALTDLADTLQEVDAQTDVIVLIDRILMAALDAVDSENASLILVDEEREELVFVEVLGEVRSRLIGYRIPRTAGIVGWAIAHRQPVLVADARQDARFFAEIDEVIGFRTTSVICVPMYVGERPLGAIEVVNKRSGEPFRAGDLHIMRLVALLAAEALHRAESPESAEKGS